MTGIVRAHRCRHGRVRISGFCVLTGVAWERGGSAMSHREGAPHDLQDATVCGSRPE